MLSLPRAVAPIGRSILKCRMRVVGASVAQRSLSSKGHIFDSGSSVRFKLKLDDIPPSPPPIYDLVDSSQSALGELGLISWSNPSYYFQMAMEGIHMYADIPWWLTIVSATVALRLALIAVPIMSHRVAAKQSLYKQELDLFKARQEHARKERDNVLAQKIVTEQRDFLKSKDIKLGRTFAGNMAYGGVFITQFFAIKGMIEANYPGFSTGGMLWFTDLTLADPYFILPLLSATTTGLILAFGVNVSQSNGKMSPWVRVVVPSAILFIATSQLGSGLCVALCASNAMSLAYAVLFRLEPIRKILKIPFVV
ncbi:hypothetical protein PMAYCL1PPCAC_03961, partial [Pristionchus mayeri]